MTLSYLNRATDRNYDALQASSEAVRLAPTSEEVLKIISKYYRETVLLSQRYGLLKRTQIWFLLSIIANLSAMLLRNKFGWRCCQRAAKPSVLT